MHTSLLLSATFLFSSPFSSQTKNINYMEKSVFIFFYNDFWVETKFLSGSKFLHPSYNFWKTTYNENADTILSRVTWMAPL